MVLVVVALLVLILILVLVLLLILILVVVLLILLLLLLLLKQFLCQGVVVLRLHIVGAQHKALAVALECLLQLLLDELRVAEVVESVSTLVGCAERVGCGSLQQTLCLRDKSLTHLRR